METERQALVEARPTRYQGAGSLYQLPPGTGRRVGVGGGVGCREGGLGMLAAFPLGERARTKESALVGQKSLARGDAWTAARGPGRLGELRMVHSERLTGPFRGVYNRLR